MEVSAIQPSSRFDASMPNRTTITERMPTRLMITWIKDKDFISPESSHYGGQFADKLV